MKQIDENREDLNRHLFESYVPGRAQHFIDHAEAYSENYRLSATVVGGVTVSVYKHGVCGPVFRYTANDGFYGGESFRRLQFRSGGKWHGIMATPESCELYSYNAGGHCERIGKIENNKVADSSVTLEEFTDRLTEFFNKELLVDGAVTE